MGRFLRIALVRDGQPFEERYLPLGTDVTLGKAQGNTFVVGQGDVPKSALLFKAHGERHTLHFANPAGRVDLGLDQPSTLAELVESGAARREEHGWSLPLPRDARGKFELGDLTVLFQLVERDLPMRGRAGAAGAVRPPVRRPLVLETTLSWEGTVLATKKWWPLQPVHLGPGPSCELQLPGRVLEHRAYPIIDGNEERLWVDLRNPHVVIASLEVGDGKGPMQPASELPLDRYPLQRPFRMVLALREGFTLEIRYAPAIARASSSPWDIQDPQPIWCLTGSAMFHALIMLLAFAIGHEMLDEGDAKAARKERQREISVMLQEQKVEQKKVEEEKAADKKKEDEKKDEDKPKEEAKPEPRPTPRTKPAVADAGSASPEARRTKLKQSVREKTFLANLGGVGDGSDSALPVGKETLYADAFDGVAAPYAVNGATSDALAPPGPANGGDGDGKQYKTLSKDERGGGNIDTANVNTGSKGADEEKKVTVNVRTGSLGAEGGVGKIDNSSVAGVFSRRKSAIRACYEKELRRNPDLKGRITLRFTIGTSGRITSISAAQNTTGDDAIASCIIAKVQDWKFDAPEGGAVTFTYPFILEAH